MYCQECGADAEKTVTEATVNNRVLLITFYYCTECDWVTLIDWYWQSEAMPTLFHNKKGMTEARCICADFLNCNPDPISNPDCPIHGAGFADGDKMQELLF